MYLQSITFNEKLKNQIKAYIIPEINLDNSQSNFQNRTKQILILTQVFTSVDKPVQAQ